MGELVFGKYEVIKRLAVGGMGEIFLARQTGAGGFDRLVILKNLLPDLAENEKNVNQFLDEARVAANLNHPNIVAIYEVGLWKGVYYIAMEYIRGESLSRIHRAVLRRGQRIPWPIAARIVHDVATGLDHAHRAKDSKGSPLNIVHRDVSPQNIMVREDGVTKVVDFGIAHAENRLTRTATGAVKGKLSYMSPEQVEGRELDGRTDVFALGIVLWELCTGERLFKDESAGKVSRMIADARVAPPSAYNEGFPPLLEEVVLSMLKRDLNQRAESAGDVAAKLRVYLDEHTDDSGLDAVASFVSSAVGDSITDRTDGLPTKKGFVIEFDGSGGSKTVELDETLPDAPREAKGRAPAIILGVVFGGLALGAVGLAVNAAMGTAEEPPPIVSGARADPEPKPEATAKLRLFSNPSDAAVYEGSHKVGKTPMIENFTPGWHTFRLERDGYEPAEVVVRLRADRDKNETVTLKAARGKSRRRKAR